MKSAHRYHRWLRFLACAVGAALAVVAVPVPAAAHTELISSNPAQGAAVQGLPPQVRLEFNQAISARLATVVLTVDQGSPQELAATVSGGVVSAATPNHAFRDGSRTAAAVAYRVVSADGHPISGKIDFTIVTPKPSGPVPSASRTPSATVPPSAASVPESEAAGPAADDEDTAEVSTMGTALLVSPLVLGLLIGVVALVRRRREDR